MLFSAKSITLEALYSAFFSFISVDNLIKVVIAPGFHLFPFRTEKLSPVTSMVLRHSGRVDSRRFLKIPISPVACRDFFVIYIRPG